jgi:uncharacterized protein with HEPN domain
MKRDYTLFLKDIINAMSSIEEFVQGMSFEEFANDDKTFSAVVRKFEVIGEATKNIPDSVREKYCYIPWNSMAGMRDILIHAYFGIDYELVWESIKNEIPRIKPELEKIIKDIKL